MSKKIIVNIRVKESGKEWDQLPSRNMQFGSERERAEFICNLAAWTGQEVRWDSRDSLTDTKTGNGHYVNIDSPEDTSPIINPS